jgi:NAD(P)-dependent dehydrogenase (short-subunit alcohol dehydrogenase family)
MSCVRIETKYCAAVALIQEVPSVMRRQQAVHVVNVSTIFDAGFAPPAIGHHIASKAALEVTCQPLAIEVMPYSPRSAPARARRECAA